MCDINLTFKRFLSIVILGLLALVVRAQCPTVYDFYGMPSTNPYWYSCSGSNFSFNLQSPENWGAYTVDWGDGTPNSSGASWNTPAAINHLYTAAVDTFVVVISQTATGCSIQGVVVMEQSSSASIQIPVGGLTQSCAPQVMEFINSSTNVSETTMFTWDFGDGTPILTFDHTNWLQTISHLYDVGTVTCETVVTLTAENYCNTVQGGNSTATFDPIRIWDLDDPGITASATLLCYPDTTVTFTNTTYRNCLFQGNIYQRYEYWNFGDYWGLGYDSIIDWTPWPPTFPHTMHYPGVGSYTVQLLDSNYCGIAPASITIQIVPPPTAGVSISTDSVCVGQPITFFQLATGTPNVYEWNFGTGWIPTGPGNITYSFSTPGTYTVLSRVAISGASSACDDVASVQVTVLPPPTVDLLATPTLACDQADVTFTSVSASAVEWNWTFGTAPGMFSGEIPPVISYNSPGVYTATLAVTAANGCSASDNIQITIHPTPVAAFNVQNLCEEDTAHFWDNTISLPSSPIVSWSWDFGDGQTSVEQNPNHVYTTTGLFDITLQVSNGYCQNTTTTPVNVEPRPVAIASADPISGCSPLLVQFGNNSTSAISYQWFFGDGGFSAEEIPSHTYVNQTGTDTTYMAVLNAINAFGCSSNDTLYVQVLANAIASFIDNANIPTCEPLLVDFLNQSQNAASYEWNFGDGASSIASDPSHLYVNNTGMVQLYPVTLFAYAANGCHDTISDPVIVFPLMNLEIDLTGSSGCGPLNIQMPFVIGLQAYFWDFGDGTISGMPAPVHQFMNTGLDPVSYNVLLTGTSPFGCTSSATTTVEVFPSPIAQFTASALSGCSPLTVVFNNLTVNGASYEWNYGDGQTSLNSDLQHSHVFINSTNQVQTYVITMVAFSASGCPASFELSVQVYPEVVAAFLNPGPQCAPADVYFANTSTNASFYEWNFGNGLASVQPNGTVSYINTTSNPIIFDVVLMASSVFGCSSIVTSPITINPLPLANFTTNESQACSPAPIIITNLSENATSYTWNYGDGTFSNNTDPEHVHVYTSTGNEAFTYTLTLAAVSGAGCVSTATDLFSLFPTVSSQFTASGEGCSPFTGVFVNQSIGATSFQWSFGDGAFSSNTNPTHVYVTDNLNDLSLTAELIASNQYGCSDTTSVPINVYHTPVAIAQVESISGCNPLEVNLINGSIGADSYNWNYGNGQTSNTAALSHTIIYTNFSPSPVTYPITLQAITANGCASSAQLEVVTPQQIEASFALNTQGCTPLTVYFDNNSTGAFSYLWNFGDGDISNEQEPVHTYFNWGTTDTLFTVTLTIQNEFGCIDSADAFVQVSPVPVAGFQADPIIQEWPESTVNIDNTTIGGALTYVWSMGDGTAYTAEEPGSHTYSTWGTYSIQLQAGNGSCSDLEVQEVIILPPSPLVNFLGPAEGCAPLTVNFTNLSEYAAISYWQFGDGGAANATNPVYTYYQPGTYTVTLTITGFDGSTEVMVQEYIIQVHPRAIAAFTITPNEVSVPSQPVYCLNLSQNATIYDWQFGDGSSSNQTNPIYYYQQEGIFDVTLIANNAFNCPDTMQVLNAVYTHIGGLIEFPNAFTPRTSGGSGGAYDPLGYENDVFFPLHEGVTEYQLLLFNKWGELLYESKDVNKGWDGYYRGSLCKQDVYVWKVRARFVDGQKFEQAGDVTLLVR